MILFEHLHRLALSAGFDDCSVAVPTYLPSDAQFMTDWVNQGLHGNMKYFEANQDKRYDPSVLVPGAKTIVVVILSFPHSGHDYHRTIKSKLYELQQALCAAYGDDIVASSQHVFCDSAPMLERRWAELSGLGFIGRNHQFFHHHLGSMVHIGELVLNVEVSKPSIEAKNTDESGVFTQCTECNRCVDACPTGALKEPVWDARKCVAYTTHKCLICQEACPINQQILSANPKEAK